MRHKRFVCKEIQPFVLQKIETIRQIRTEFEKYITGIDTYEVIKQVCTLTPHPTNTLTTLYTCNSRKSEYSEITTFH